MDFEGLCQRIHYRFSDIDLLRCALTHRSFGSPHNERLEFLGDSVLNCVVTQSLFERFPDLPEGDLTRLRASIVKEASLAEAARRLSLGDHLRLGEGELKGGGASRPSMLADATEAIVGAAFMDGGYDAAQQVVQALLGDVLSTIDPATTGKDPKTQLQEFLQARRLALPQYAVIATHGEAHAQQFQVECVVAELGIRSIGEGASRRGAEQEAARRAYDLANRA